MSETGEWKAMFGEYADEHTFVGSRARAIAWLQDNLISAMRFPFDALGTSPVKMEWDGGGWSLTPVEQPAAAPEEHVIPAGTLNAGDTLTVKFSGVLRGKIRGPGLVEQANMSRHEERPTPVDYES